MKLWKKAVNYQQVQNAMFENNQTEIEDCNSKMIRMLLVMGCISFGLFLIVPIVFASYRKLAVPYLVVFCLLCLFLLLFRRLQRIIPTAYLMYVGYGCMVLYSIYTSAFVTPDFNSVIILFFLFEMPIITLDKSWRVNLIEVIYMLAYMVCAIPFKEQRLIMDEILNCLLFTAIAIVLGEYLRKAKLENFELKRQSLIREKTDYLTGLNNRRSLFESLEELEQKPEPRDALGIIIIDIDNFKLFNDTYGHQQGDVCLKKICDCFQAFGDTAGIAFYRYGGEEFVGVATGCSANELLAQCRNLNRAISDLNIPHLAVERGLVTISIGAATAGIGGGAGYQQLLSQADAALYAAKTGGRNRAVFYTPAETLPISAR